MQSMRATKAVLLGLLGTGCLAGSGSFDWYSVPTQQHAPLPPAPPPATAPVSFARHHAAGARYRREATAWIGLAHVSEGMRIRLAADVTVSGAPGGYREHLRIDEAEAEGAAIYMNPEPGTRYLVGAELSMGYDHRNRPTSPPRMSRVDDRADTLVAEVARVIFGRLRVPHPPAAVRPGDRWEGEPIRMDTREAGGWIELTLRPRYELTRVEDGRGLIRWSGTVETQPFCQLGPCLRGSGTLRGTSQVSLRDGYEGRTELEIDVEIRGRDAAESSPPIIEIEARFWDRRWAAG